MRNFLHEFHMLCERSGARSCYEFGCGEGELALGLAKKGWKVQGSDLESAVVESSRQLFQDEGLVGEFDVLDILEFDPLEISTELVICCEVLEHLPAPEKALTNLVATGAPRFLLSVPREPLWRALNVSRGKYLAQFGNTPGHLQNWSKGSFIKMISRHMTIESIRNPLPWTMLLCRHPDL